MGRNAGLSAHHRRRPTLPRSRSAVVGGPAFASCKRPLTARRPTLRRAPPAPSSQCPPAPKEGKKETGETPPIHSSYLYGGPSCFGKIPAHAISSVRHHSPGCSTIHATRPRAAFSANLIFAETATREPKAARFSPNPTPGHDRPRAPPTKKKRKTPVPPPKTSKPPHQGPPTRPPPPGRPSGPIRSTPANPYDMPPAPGQRTPTPILAIPTGNKQPRRTARRPPPHARN